MFLFVVTLFSLSDLVTFMVCVTTSFFFSGKIESLSPGRTTFGFVVNLSGVTLFDELDIEDFDIVDIIYMSGEKC